MNRINPLYIILLLILLFFVALFKLHSAKMQLLESEKSYKKSMQLTVELSGLKDAYSRRFILSPSVKNLVLQRKIKNGLIISSKNIDINSLNILMGKVINGTYNITKLNITRLNDTQASIYMELKW